MAKKKSSPKQDKRERCRWCNTPFEEIPESPHIPGVCEYIAKNTKMLLAK